MTVPAQLPDTRPSAGYREIAIAEVGGGGMLLPRSFGEVVAFAELMSRSQHAIPAHLRNNPGACMAVAMQALRWEMDPFAVAAKTYSVKDLVAYEAQLFAAVVNTRAPIKNRPDYSFEGAGPKLRCTVSVNMNDGSVKSYTSPEIGSIKVKNSPLWVADPEQQLGYYSIRAWARRYCPEVIMGVYSPDEIEAQPRIGPDRARDVTPSSSRSLSDRLTALATVTDEPDPTDSKPARDVNEDTETRGDGSREGSLEQSKVVTEATSATVGSSDPAHKEPPADDTFPGDRVDDPLAIARARGAEAHRMGMARKAIPGEYREKGREAEARAWLEGYDADRVAAEAREGER